MSIRIYRCDGDIYLTRVGTLPCLRWYLHDERWRSQVAPLPAQVDRVTPEQIPDDLREELLAFVARAEAMGPAATLFGN